MNKNRKASSWNAEKVAFAVEQFVMKYGRLPVAKEMKRENSLPSRRTFESKVGVSFYKYGKTHHPELVELSETRHRQNIADSVREKSAWTKETFMATVQHFVEQHGRLPAAKEYTSENNLPSYTTFCRIAEAALTDYLGELFLKDNKQNLSPKEIGTDSIEKDSETRIRELRRPDQGKSTLDKKLKSFGADQVRLIRDATEQIVLYALKEAEPDEDELYCEVDYDIVNRCLSPLDDMGTLLSIEKIAELINEHPAVDYSDYHNTGITVYFNSPKILQGLGLRPGYGMTDMHL